MARATKKERSEIPTPKPKLLIGEKIKITEVTNSKMTIDDNIASFKTSFNINTLKQHGVELSDVANILNRLGEITIVPYQQQAQLADPNQTDIEDEE